MNRLLVVLLISACTGIESPDVDAKRQAADGLPFFDLPELVGDPGAHLGAGIATCDHGKVVYFNAPGARKLLMNNNGFSLTIATQGFDDGGAIACASRQIPDGGRQVNLLIAGAPTQQLNGSVYSSFGGSSSRVAAFDQYGVFPQGSGFFTYDLTVSGLRSMPDGGHPIADLALENADTVALVALDQNLLQRFVFDGGVWSELPHTALGVRAERVVVGNVDPHPGHELIVAGSNSLNVRQVQIIGADGTLLTTLTAPTPGDFGASLAIEKSTRFQLDLLWVGQPSINSVFRYTGTDWALFPVTSELFARAGHVIAIEPSRDVWVGAPDYGGGRGAVFRIEALEPMAGGTALLCRTNADCLGCNTLCVGGKACTASQCPVSQSCNLVTATCQPLVVIDAGAPDGGDVDAGLPDAGDFDAGAFDAGAPDAGDFDAGIVDAGNADGGENLDGGAPDAGAPDAGQTDAGPQRPNQFTSCGCSSAEALFAVVALALVIRKRRR